MRYQTNYTPSQIKAACPSIFATTQRDTLSDKYVHISTEKIIDKLYDNGFKIVGVKEQGSRRSSVNGVLTDNKMHAKHAVYLGHSNIDALSLNEGYPMIRLQNSHNGLSAFQIDTGFYRLVCNNGLIMPQSAISSARIKHTNVLEKDVIEASYKIVESMPEQIRMINEMKTIGLNLDERMILAESAVNLTFDEETIELNRKNGLSIADRLLRPRNFVDRSNQNIWSTFNTVQENVIKGGVRIIRPSGYRKTKAITGIDADKKINVELMRLAQEMMRLKIGA